MLVPLGTAIPLYVILETTDAKLVRANIIDPRSGEMIASDLTLSAVSGRPGHYSNASQLMPDRRNLIAEVSVFELDGTTLFAKGAMEIDLDADEEGGASGSAQTDISTLVVTLDDNDEITAFVDDDSIIAIIEEEG